PASAFPKVTFAPPKTGTIKNLVPVMAQSARCAAVSDVHQMLAFGHDKAYTDAQVSLVRLDAQGTPLAYATPIKLPRPSGLDKLPSYVTGVAFHPRLPLLYVWQDFAGVYANPPPAAPKEVMLFDHLHIVSFAKETPEVLISLCRGQEYIYAQGG